MDGDESANRTAQRASTSDRQAAVDALTVHTRAGRITTQEFEERSESVKRALTWGDIDALFADLPAPHPSPIAEPAVVVVDRVTPVPDVPPPPSSATTRRLGGDEQAGLVPRQAGHWLMALAPPAALVLFLTTSQWWWFLLIPVVSTVVYGPHGGAAWHGHGGHGGHGSNRHRNR